MRCPGQRSVEPIYVIFHMRFKWRFYSNCVGHFLFFGYAELSIGIVLVSWVLHYVFALRADSALAGTAPILFFSAVRD